MLFLARQSIAGGSKYSTATLPSTITGSHTVVTPTNALASFTLGADGNYSGTTGISTTQWAYPLTAAANFEVQLAVTSGSFGGATTGSYIACTSDRTWTVARTTDTPGSTQAIGTLTIRWPGGAVLATCTLTLTATVDAG